MTRDVALLGYPPSFESSTPRAPGELQQKLLGKHSRYARGYGRKDFFASAGHVAVPLGTEAGYECLWLPDVIASDERCTRSLGLEGKHSGVSYEG